MPDRGPSLPEGARPTITVGLGCLLFGGWHALDHGRVLDRGGDVSANVRFGPGRDELIDFLEASQTPFHLPESGAIFLVSLLLMVAGVLLLMRRRSGRWWGQQALVANVLVWTLVAGLGVWHVLGSWDLLVQRLQTFLDVAGGPVRAEGQVRSQLVQLTVFRALLVAFYGWLLWRVTRPDVSAWLRARRP